MYFTSAHAGPRLQAKTRTAKYVYSIIVVLYNTAQRKSSSVSEAKEKAPVNLSD